MVELKAKGHEIIDDLERMGMSRNGINGSYARLSRHMKVQPHKAHFRSIHSVKELERAVLGLTQIREEYISKKIIAKKAKQKAKYEKVLPSKVLPLEEQKKALEELKVINTRKNSWWKKLIHILFFTR